MSLSYSFIQLRPFRRGDKREYVRLREENAVWLDCWEALDPGIDPSSRSYPEIFRAVRASHRAGSAVTLGLFVRGKLVGHLHYSPLSHGASSEARVGYWIARESAGAGLGALMLAMGNEYMIHERGFHRIEALVQPQNAASLATVRKAAMSPEGIRRSCLFVDGAWRDHEAFSLLETDLDPTGDLVRALAARAGIE